MASCCKSIGLLLLLWFTVSCANNDTAPPPVASKAEALIAKAIAAHGGDRYRNMEAQFTFRGTPFTIQHKGGLFRYTQQRIDSLGDTIHYVLDNDGLHKTINDSPTMVWAEKEQAKYGETTNSVVYFALLPYGLQAPAVQAKYIDSVFLRGNPYHKVGVTFSPEGGGVDYEDRFVYWIHAQSHTIDYLAYAYHTNGGGMRFREAYRVQMVNGVRWQDYINYGPVSGKTSLYQLDSLFVAGKLDTLSTIDLKQMEVKLLPTVL